MNSSPDYYSSKILLSLKEMVADSEEPSSDDATVEVCEEE
jgi:hypothetical protein